MDPLTGALVGAGIQLIGGLFGGGKRRRAEKRATGASAGGATALAQAALQSKKGISASIEQQEVANEKLKADGKAQLEQIRMGEAGRIQNIQMSEAQRMQQSDVAGKQFVFGQQAQASAQAGIMSGLGNIAGSYIGTLPG